MVSVPLLKLAETLLGNPDELSVAVPLTLYVIGVMAVLTHEDC